MAHLLLWPASCSHCDNVLTLVTYVLQEFQVDYVAPRLIRWRCQSFDVLQSGINSHPCNRDNVFIGICQQGQQCGPEDASAQVSRRQREHAYKPANVKAIVQGDNAFAYLHNYLLCFC